MQLVAQSNGDHFSWRRNESTMCHIKSHILWWHRSNIDSLVNLTYDLSSQIQITSIILNAFHRWNGERSRANNKLNPHPMTVGYRSSLMSVLQFIYPLQLPTIIYWFRVSIWSVCIVFNDEDGWGFHGPEDDDTKQLLRAWLRLVVKTGRGRIHLSMHESVLRLSTTSNCDIILASTQSNRLLRHPI